MGVVFSIQEASNVVGILVLAEFDRPCKGFWADGDRGDRTTLGGEARPLSGSAPEASDLGRDKPSQKVNGRDLLEVEPGADGRRSGELEFGRSRFQPEWHRSEPILQ